MVTLIPFDIPEAAEDDFRLIRILSDGKFSTVALVRCDKNLTTMVKKTIKNISNQSLTRKAFINEVTALFITSQLSDSNSVNSVKCSKALSELSNHFPSIKYIISVNPTIGNPEYSFVMEYLADTIVLLEWLQRVPLNDTKTILSVFIQITQLITHIHSKDLIHSDLNPSNILVDTHGSVFIVDFGQVTFVTNLPTKAFAGNDSGHPLIRPPETQIEGVAFYSSDVFSFGKVIQMCCYCLAKRTKSELEGLNLVRHSSLINVLFHLASLSFECTKVQQIQRISEKKILEKLIALQYAC